MGLVITDLTNRFEVELNGLSADRKRARIRKASIRSVVEASDNSTVEIVFDNGEIQRFPYQVVDSVAGDTDMTSQDKLYLAVDTLIFG